MKKEGVTSYWIGKGESKPSFYQLLEYTISDNGMGDFVACPFCKYLGIVSYDPDYFGGSIWQKDLRLSLLFNGDPALPELLKTWPEIPPSNCCISLSDYAYNGSIANFELSGFKFIFLGVFGHES